MILEDGRNYLARVHKSFDAISIEISSIWFAGASNLYSSEFYRQIKSHLAVGGVLQQWMQLHHLSPKEIVTILATMRENFQYMDMWFFGGQAILLASDTPMVLHQERLRLFSESELFVSERQALRELGEDVDSILSLRSRLFDTNQIDIIISKIPHAIHTDRNKWLEFHTPLHYLDNASMNVDTNMKFLMEAVKQESDRQ